MFRLCRFALKRLDNFHMFHSGIRLRYPIQIKMPSLSPTMTEGSIVRWSKKEGEEVSPGDVICEVQTDKAVVALECDEEGTLAKIMVPPESSNIKVGELIAVLATSEEDWKVVAADAPTAVAHSATDSPASTKPEAVKEQTIETPKSTEVSGVPCVTQTSTMGPAVRLLLQSFGLDGSQIPATGPHGQLLKGDVLLYIAQKQSQCTAATPTLGPKPSTTVTGSTTSNYTDIPLSNMRKVIAKRLTESKSSIPHAYVRGIAYLDRIQELREIIKTKTGVKLSVNEFIVKACGLGLRLVPSLNAISDPVTNTSVYSPNVDICMAVATPSGLITPIIQSADILPISHLAKSASDLAKRAREGKLQPHEFQGGSFTISNLGMFGIREFTAIINPPQVAIMAVGTGIPEPYLIDPENETISFAKQVTMTLSIDSRYVDEAAAGAFLKNVSSLLSQHPEILLDGDPIFRSISKSHNSQIETDEFEMMMLSNTHPVPTKGQKRA